MTAAAFEGKFRQFMKLRQGEQLFVKLLSPLVIYLWIRKVFDYTAKGFRGGWDY